MVFGLGCKLLDAAICPWRVRQCNKRRNIRSNRIWFAAAGHLGIAACVCGGEKVRALRAAAAFHSCQNIR